MKLEFMKVRFVIKLEYRPLNLIQRMVECGHMFQYIIKKYRKLFINILMIIEIYMNIKSL